MLIAITLFNLSIVSFGTYALWTSTDLLTNNNSINTGQIKMSYTETNEIGMNNALPIKDSEGKILTNYFDFQVLTYIKTKATDNTERKINYNIVLEPISVDNPLNDNEIKVYLTMVKNGNETVVVEPTTIDKLIDKILSSKGEIFSNNKKEVVTRYRLRAWIDENVDMNKLNEKSYSYRFRVNVNGSSLSNATSKQVDTSGANKPLLTSNMIPVYYDSTSKVWKKADESNTLEKYTYKLGDINNDGVINEGDVSIMRYNTNMNQKANTKSRIAGDMNKDGYITEEDVNIIRNNGYINKPATEEKTGYVKSDNAWYDYDDKIWANAVTVTETNRETYLKASAGTEIQMDDINTMWVWVPRYTYTMLNTCDSIKNPTEEANPWCYGYVYKDEYHDDLVNELMNNFGFDESKAEETVAAWKKGDSYLKVTFDGYVTDTGEGATKLTFDKSFISTNVSEQSFNIKFEKGTNSSGTIKCTDAVTGQSSTSETCTDSTNGSLKAGTSTYTHPAFTFGNKELTGIWVGKFEISSGQMIKPNVSSLKGLTVSQFYTNVYNMRNSGNVFGFATTDETHMMKNMEWGAVTYLSHSKYGINKKIALKSANTFTTGCGPQSEGSAENGATCNAYNTALGQSASTTGNVYGIYDMRGGAYEFLMGNMVDASGAFNPSSSGFSAAPDAKYYDKYSYGTTYNDRTAYSRGKLGDATKEMTPMSLKDWYSEYAYFPDDSRPWFIRGGAYDDGLPTGIFGFSGGIGDASDSFGSTRAVISN